jgi:hypothetical protein
VGAGDGQSGGVGGAGRRDVFGHRVQVAKRSVGGVGWIAGDEAGGEPRDGYPSSAQGSNEGSEGGASEASMCIGDKACIIDTSDGGDCVEGKGGGKGGSRRRGLEKELGTGGENGWEGKNRRVKRKGRWELGGWGRRGLGGRGGGGGEGVWYGQGP